MLGVNNPSQKQLVSLTSRDQALFLNPRAITEVKACYIALSGSLQPSMKESLSQAALDEKHRIVIWERIGRDSQRRTQR